MWWEYVKVAHWQLLDVFSSGASVPSINLVLEYLNTDLEAIIKDRSLVFRANDIKSWMFMLCRGIEYCHRHWCLHRVRRLTYPGSQAEQPACFADGRAENC